jgi:hypothetical protein
MPEVIQEELEPLGGHGGAEQWAEVSPPQFGHQRQVSRQ